MKVTAEYSTGPAVVKGGAPVQRDALRVSLSATPLPGMVVLFDHRHDRMTSLRGICR